MVIRSMCMRSPTRFISSMGHGAPDITPLRSELRSNRPNSGCSSSATYIVGTPYNVVARSRSTASSVASASNCAEGRISAAPFTQLTIPPITEPKQ
jgi:hypothetical protein